MPDPSPFPSDDDTPPMIIKVLALFVGLAQQSREDMEARELFLDAINDLDLNQARDMVMAAVMILAVQTDGIPDPSE